MRGHQPSLGRPRRAERRPLPEDRPAGVLERGEEADLMIAVESLDDGPERRIGLGEGVERREIIAGAEPVADAGQDRLRRDRIKLTWLGDLRMERAAEGGRLHAARLLHAEPDRLPARPGRAQHGILENHPLTLGGRKAVEERQRLGKAEGRPRPDGVGSDRGDHQAAGSGRV
jgi:hypothetical protein